MTYIDLSFGIIFRKKLETLLAEQEKLEREKENNRKSSMRRSSTSLSQKNKKEIPKSMVSYEKGTPREFDKKDVLDNREHGLTHES